MEMTCSTSLGDGSSPGATKGGTARRVGHVVGTLALPPPKHRGVHRAGQAASLPHARWVDTCTAVSGGDRTPLFRVAAAPPARAGGRQLIASSVAPTPLPAAGPPGRQGLRARERAQPSVEWAPPRWKRCAWSWGGWLLSGWPACCTPRLDGRLHSRCTPWSAAPSTLAATPSAATAAVSVQAALLWISPRPPPQPTPPGHQHHQTLFFALHIALIGHPGLPYAGGSHISARPTKHRLPAPSLMDDGDDCEPDPDDKAESKVAEAQEQQVRSRGRG